jgi:hypothetical protein
MTANQSVLTWQTRSNKLKIMETSIGLTMRVW